MKRALFLDRDGIFNSLVVRDGGMHSPRSWEEVSHFGGLENLTAIRQQGFQLILVTNQPDIERGIVPLDFCRDLHAYYQRIYSLDSVYLCPFASPNHPWKKPNPGMFLQAHLDYGLDLSACFHLGDTSSDIVAAHRAGITPLLWDRPYNLEVTAEHRVRNLAEVQDILFR